MIDRATTKRLFENLFWPAAAGNVAWALVTVCLSAGDNFWPRVSILLLLSIYLAADWIRIDGVPDETPHIYWVFDFIHLSTIAVFAIATQLEKPFLGAYLAVIFSVSVLGHMFGFWDQSESVTKRKFERITLTLMNAVGLAIVGANYFWLEFDIWHLPAAILVVLVIWAILRMWLIDKWVKWRESKKK